MKVLVCGGRDFHKREFLFKTMDSIRLKILPKYIDIVIQGGANGADYLAKIWATTNGIHYADVPALWGTHGRSAGPIRNRVMCDLLTPSDLVVAFPGGTGTKHMIRTARDNKIPVMIVTDDGVVLDD